MNKTYVSKQDRRPALAFDEKKEVQTIIDALQAFRYSHVNNKETSLDEYIRKICDQLEKCEKMFNKKEEIK